MGLSTEAAPAVGRQAVPDGFAGLLDSFRARLDRELEALLAAKRDEAAYGGSGEMLELIDGIAELATEGG